MIYGVPPRMPGDSNPIIFYDGVCALCNGFVQFILKRDTQDRFRFAAQQSEFARSVLCRHGASAENLESIYLVVDHGRSSEQLQTRSNAAISILRELGPFWRALANLFVIFPLGLRDWGYNLVARCRYRMFGKYDACPLPQAKDRHKFLDLHV